MSYILEALKRAERERRAGKTSLLDEVASAAPPAPTPRWPRWLPAAGVSALVAVVLLYILFTHRGQPSSQPVPVLREQPPVAAVVPAPQPTAAAASAPPPAASTVAPAASVPRTTPPAAATIEDEGRIASLDDLESPAPVATRANRAAMPGSAASSSGTGATSPNPLHQGEDARQAASRAKSESATAASDAAVPPPDEAQAGQAQSLREMPDAYRAGFPSITVDVHAYSDDPSQRFVLIDGKRYHENDSLPQGPRILAIVADGIVFDWKGERVLYAINH